MIEQTTLSTTHAAKPRWPYIIAILGTFLIVGLLVWAMKQQNAPPALNEARKAERAKALAEVRATEAQLLTQPAWIDKDKKVVRLPIQTAMQIVIQKWQDPKAARAELGERVAKATAMPPPAPAKPSEFE